jgi:hypothetical protein
VGVKAFIKGTTQNCITYWMFPLSHPLGKLEGAKRSNISGSIHTVL